MRFSSRFLVTSGMSFLTVLMASGRTVLYGNLFGAGAETDAYYNAFLWFRVFLEDMPALLLPALLPWYSQVYNSSSGTTARHEFIQCVLMRGLGFLVLIAILALMSPLILQWTAANLSDDARSLANKMTLAFLAISPGLFLATMYRLHLESQRRFVASGVFRMLLWAWAIVGLLASPWLGIWSGVLGPALGVIFGVVLLRWLYLNDLKQKSPVTESVKVQNTKMNVSNTSLATMLVSVVLQRAAGFLDLHFSSEIAPGALTEFMTVGTLVSLPVVLLVQALSTVLTPEIAKWRVEGREDLLRRMLPKLIASVFVASATAAGVVCLSAEFLIHLLFSHGSLAPEQLAAMTTILRYFSISIVLLSIQTALSGLTASLGGFYVLVLLPAVALVSRYFLLASYGPHLTLVSLVFGHYVYHGIWAAGLTAYTCFWIRSSRLASTRSMSRLNPALPS